MSSKKSQKILKYNYFENIYCAYKFNQGYHLNDSLVQSLDHNALNNK